MASGWSSRFAEALGAPVGLAAVGSVPVMRAGEGREGGRQDEPAT